MAKDSSGLIILIGGAAVAWFGYTQGWFNSFFAPAVASTPAPLPAVPACPAPSVLINGVCTAPAVTQGTNPPMQSAPVTLPTSTIAACGAAGQPTCTPATTLALVLNALAGGSGTNFVQLNIDQWAYYYNGIAGKTPITGAQFVSMMAAAGITNATRSTQMMDASQFVALLAGVGLSGMGQVGRRYIPVPSMLRPAYRAGQQYTMADLRRAGRR